MCECNFLSKIADTPLNYQKHRDQASEQWYRCARCFEQLFKIDNVVGSIGETTERNDFERQLLIVKKPHINHTKMLYSYRTCAEIIRPQVVLCPECHILLSIPIQHYLGCTSPPRYPRERKAAKEVQFLHLAEFGAKISYYFFD